MNRRQFTGLSLAAVGGVFVPRFGVWFPERRVWRVKLYWRGQLLEWRSVAPHQTVSFGLMHRPFDELRVIGQTGLVGSSLDCVWPAGLLVSVDTRMCHRRIHYPSGETVTVE
jgi:hypothetical protein